MPTERSEDKNTAESDDLTAIEGIGAQRERWLREALGASTYKALAALSADDVESRLRAEGQSVSRSAIEGWIARASELAAVAKGVHQDWRPFAQFVVEFQRRDIEKSGAKKPVIRYRTQVHDIEADQTKRWAGIDPERLCAWISRRPNVGSMLEDEEAAPAEPEAEAEAEATPSLTAVEITEIRLVQPPETEMPHGLSVRGQPFFGPVRGDKPFASEVSFALTEEAASAEAKQGGRYRIELFAKNLATATRTPLGKTTPVSVTPDTLSYTAVLPEATLSTGVYRLSVLASREDGGTVSEFLAARPLLRVI
jgi:hypothetical protein